MKKSRELTRAIFRLLKPPSCPGAARQGRCAKHPVDGGGDAAESMVTTDY